MAANFQFTNKGIKIRKILEFESDIKQLNVTDICGTSAPTLAQHTLSACAREFKRMEIIRSIFSDHAVMELETGRQKLKISPTY